MYNVRVENEVPDYYRQLHKMVYIFEKAAAVMFPNNDQCIFLSSWKNLGMSLSFWCVGLVCV